MIHIEHKDETRSAFTDALEADTYGRILLFAASYLPPSVNRSYRSYAVKYRPKGTSEIKWRAVMASSGSLRQWKGWFSNIASALLKETDGTLWFPAGIKKELASVKATIVMGENSDVDGRTKAVQDAFQGCAFENDKALGASCDVRLVTHKRKDQGVIYILCYEEYLLPLSKIVCDARREVRSSLSDKREYGESVYKMYGIIKERIVR